jgi:ferredoxin-nitrate reductase
MSTNFVQISVKDAEKLEIKEGDLVDVQSRRGAVRLEVKIGEIDEGQIFIPFHFGSIDGQGAASQAGNELTRYVAYLQQNAEWRRHCV